MRILQIRTNDELKIPLDRVEELWESENVKELDELDAMVILVIDY